MCRLKSDLSLCRWFVPNCPKKISFGLLAVYGSSSWNPPCNGRVRPGSRHVSPYFTCALIRAPTFTRADSGLIFSRGTFTVVEVYFAGDPPPFPDLSPRAGRRPPDRLWFWFVRTPSSPGLRGPRSRSNIWRDVDAYTLTLFCAARYGTSLSGDRAVADDISFSLISGSGSSRLELHAEF